MVKKIMMCAAAFPFSVTGGTGTPVFYALYDAAGAAGAAQGEQAGTSNSNRRFYGGKYYGKFYSTI